MKKRQFLIPVLVGLIVGQIFAEGDRPFTIINTLRFGYDDNVDRSASNPESSAYIQDIVDLAFRAALSDRTDLIFKSRFEYRTDKESNFYPNIYAILTHSVSPRLFLQLSDKYKSGSKTSSSAAISGRYNYFENTVSFTPSYVLSPKDRLSVPVSYKIKRNEDTIDDEDLNLASVGLTWKRDLRPQRTWAALNLSRTMVDYINRDTSYTANQLTAELSHTFNQEWHGHVEVGVTFSESEFPSYTNSLGDVVSPQSSVHPLFAAGLAYEPSPRTRLTVDVSRRYQESNDSRHTAETASELRFGAQHDFTAKIMGKATARFLKSERDEMDDEATNTETTEDRFDLDFRLHYKLNRINFLELGLKHSEKAYDTGNRDWTQNMIDIGWRVEL